MSPENIGKVKRDNTNIFIYDNGLNDELKKLKKNKGKLISSKPTPNRGTPLNHFVNYCTITEAHMVYPYDDVEFRLDLESFKLELKEEEVLVFDLYFSEEYLQNEIADMLGLTQGRISQIISSIEERYIKFMEEEDE